jgi:lipopolysaccharide transport system ATP-binding protein
MGMTPKEISTRLDDIASFCDLGNYLSMPFRTYSSGMQMRLAFAVSTCVEADILVMDEWLSVGDQEFQAKAARRLTELVERTPILVVATHSSELVRKVCTRVIELSHGKLVSDQPASANFTM